MRYSNEPPTGAPMDTDLPGRLEDAFMSDFVGPADEQGSQGPAGDALFDALVQVRCCLEPRQESFKDEAVLVARSEGGSNRLPKWHYSR